MRMKAQLRSTTTAKDRAAPEGRREAGSAPSELPGGTNSVDAWISTSGLCNWKTIYCRYFEPLSLCSLLPYGRWL